METCDNASTTTAPTIETVGSNGEDSQSVDQRDKSSNNDKADNSNEDMPRADCNNPAKSTFFRITNKRSRESFSASSSK